MSIESTILKVVKSVESAYLRQSKLTDEVLAIEGQSSAYNRHFLNNIVDDGTSYLEIGTLKGSTLISALYQNRPVASYAIDNWSQFGGPKETFESNLAKYIPSANLKVFNIDAFLQDYSQLHEVNVFFYDGDHTFEAQRDIVGKAMPCFVYPLIYIVDDWNWERVRLGTAQGILDNKLSIKFHMSIPSNRNRDIDGWWNGTGIFVLTQ